MKRAVTIIASVGLFICSATVAGGGYLYYLSLPPDSSDSEPVAFRVEEGEPVARIASRLQEEGLLRSVLPIRLLSRFNETEARFQRGNYALQRDMSAVEVHRRLTTGSQVLTRVTIPEGRSTGQIARILDRHGIAGEEEFRAAVADPELARELGIPADSAEGYLFPDTYHFPEEFPAELVVRTMAATFFRTLDRIAPEHRRLEPQELHRRVIMASIIEREYITKEEAPLIASVFYNRLEAGMRLESCATVVYVMTEQQGLPHPDRLFYRDLERQSDYNTYLHAGLPPGPISTPGAVSLDAAFNPATTDYWFFVLRGPNAKEHHFSRTFQEHNQATVLYLRSP